MEEAAAVGEGALSHKRKRDRELDWTQYHERQIALRLAYVGWNMAGFQGEEGSNTVENHLFAALIRTKLVRSRSGCHYSLCGRTDAGVSACGNVVSVRVRSTKSGGPGSIRSETGVDRESEIDYATVLNGVLVETIRVVAVAFVDRDFNARFGCRGRTYRYFFAAAGLDLAKMQLAARSLEGEHDFRAFCKFSPSSTRHCVRRITRVDVDPAFLEVEGSGFVWHQVRCIAAVLFLVGRGLEDPSITAELLDTARFPGRPCYDIAPAEPLVFWDASYPDIAWTPVEEGAARRGFCAMLRQYQLRVAVLEAITGPCGSERARAHKKVATLAQAPPIEEVLARWDAERGGPAEPDGD